MKNALRAAIRDPLVHFLAAAFGVFVVFDLVADDERGQDAREIYVTRENLLTYMQYRARAFDPDRFAEVYRGLSQADRDGLVEEYVREEALYREAKALQLDRNDYIARKRMIQQLEFIAQGYFDPESSLSDAELESYFEQHRPEYDQPATVTFAHVFFSNDRHGREEALAMAGRKLAVLNAEEVAFHEAMQHGDRALYHVNYVQKEIDLVGSHFGSEMACALFEMEPDETVWRGPLRSPYGSHLVLLIRQRPASSPAFEEVRPRVEADAMAAMQRERLRTAVDAIVSTYRVRRAEDVGASEAVPQL